MIGHLSRLGIHVPRSKIRASIHRVDPVIRSITVRRRVYHVDGPNCLWHVDGNHKLIKWKFVIHGGIDGFSRTLVYLHCSTNNRAITHLSLFVGDVQSYGLSEKVRSNLGGENVDIWRYMVELLSPYPRLTMKELKRCGGMFSGVLVFCITRLFKDCSKMAS